MPNPDPNEIHRTRGAEAVRQQIDDARRMNGPDREPTSDAPVTLDDFVAYMPRHNFLYRPAREFWPGVSVNARIPPIPLEDDDGHPVLDDNGNQVKQSASAWLDKNKPVEQMTWAPGLPEIIQDRLIAEGGWIERHELF
jgi:hypothetical protein